MTFKRLLHTAYDGLKKVTRRFECKRPHVCSCVKIGTGLVLLVTAGTFLSIWGVIPGLMLDIAGAVSAAAIVAAATID